MEKFQPMVWFGRCHNVNSDESGKVKFHVPLSASLPKDVTKLSIKVTEMVKSMCEAN